MTNNPILIYGKKSQKINGIIFSNQSDFESSLFDKKAISLGINELKKIEKSFVQNKKLPELFTYDNESLWWFFYPELSIKILQITNFVNNFSNFINEVKPKIIKIDDDFYFFEIIKQVANNNKIPLKYSHKKLLEYKTKKKIEINLRYYRAKILTAKKIKKRKAIFLAKKSHIPLIKEKIVFTGFPLYRRYIFDFDEGITKKDEFIFKDFFKLLGKKEFVGIDFFSYLSSNDKILEERIKSDIDWFPVEALFSSNLNSEIHKKFIKTFEKILNLQEFQKLFVFNSIEYWDNIFEVLEKFKFSYYLPFWLTLIDSLNEFFSKNKPKCIFLIYETGPLSLAIIKTARKHGIKTIGVQHGMIYEHHRSYMHDNFFTTTNPYGFPLPDKLLLFGNISRDILIKNGYPEKNLITFGNPSFFGLDEKKLISFYYTSLKKLNLKQNKKYILFAPPAARIKESGSNDNYNVIILKKLLESFQNQDDIVILMKPHPSENFTIYENIIQQYPNTLARILQTSIFEAILISSLMITTFSTTIIDALSLKKPVIQVKIQDVAVDTPFDKFNAIYSTSLEQMPASIKKLLDTNDITSSLLTNASKFIKEYYNIPISNPKANLEKIIYDTKENQ